uniref:Tetratricopeptide repeat-containing protein n=1 Tax=Candidatus Kentrum sp. FW TaxID=2126338 RepID=A0A450TU95_9GAMM|nr:MAG: hypothetical protein BECKFW1821C_GA0114237_103321 [Candidatus Kentron sp. FW]
MSLMIIPMFVSWNILQQYRVLEEQVERFNRQENLLNSLREKLDKIPEDIGEQSGNTKKRINDLSSKGDDISRVTSSLLKIQAYTLEAHIAFSYKKDYSEAYKYSDSAFEKVKEVDKEFRTLCVGGRKNWNNNCKVWFDVINHISRKAYVLNARSAWKLEKWDEATRSGHKIIEIYRDHGEMDTRDGPHYAALGRMVQLMQYTKDTKKDKKGRFDGGKVAQDIKTVVHLLEKSIEIQPKDNSDYLNLAEVHLYNGSWHEAKKALSDARENIEEIRTKKSGDLKKLYDFLESVVSVIVVSSNKDAPQGECNYRIKYDKKENNGMESVKENWQKLSEEITKGGRLKEYMLEAFAIRLERGDYDKKDGQNFDTCVMESLRNMKMFEEKN